MKKALKKVRGSAGESIGETLVALLISALALLMLAGAISAAAKIVTRNRTDMNTYYLTTQISIQADWEERVSKEDTLK